jgi:uncharacterized membrane protein (DUF373 family)
MSRLSQLQQVLDTGIVAVVRQICHLVEVIRPADGGVTVAG